MKARKFRRIWGHPWDYSYLLSIEQCKLKEMSAHFKKHQLTVGWEFQVRDCELCIKLIDIILERDVWYRSWLHTNYGPNPQSTSFPKYVNIKNSKRFMPHVDFDKNPKMFEHLKIALRQQKAMYLYNKIRAYRMFHWWD
jgi:hypothetical protein